MTFIFEGDVMHHDSLGTTSIIKDGGVQWMTAARGIVHTEDTSDDFKEHGGVLDIAQLWINLPAKLKMGAVKYQGINKEDIPVLKSDNDLVKLNVISGTFDNVKGPVDSITDIDMATIEIQAGGKYTARVDLDRNILFYVLSGDVIVNGKESSDRALYLFENDGTEIKIESKSNARIIIGSGIPYKEKIVAYGPFVMNDTTQIMEAQRDYQMGEMGILID